MKKFVLRALQLAALLLMGGLLLSWVLLAGSLPSLDGDIRVAGLDSPAAIERDALGIATIRGKSRADVAFATGFAHAQDRYFQMDLSRRRAAGELSEIFGRVALPLDRQSRLHRFRSRAGQVVARLPAEHRRLLEAYVRGVNEGLASLKARPFEYFLLGVSPAPWTEDDSMLVAYAMFMTLNDTTAKSDVLRGLAERELPASVYAWMYPRGTAWDAPIIGAARSVAPVPGPEQYDLSDLHFADEPRDYPEAVLPGSNNWAVSGELTESGGAIVANDMHLEIAVPNVFYRARLVVADAIELNGLTLPGTPLLIAGSNGSVAWGFTNSYGDWTDAVRLVMDGEEAYVTADGPRAFDVHEEEIRIKGGDPETLLIRETVWGPVRPALASWDEPLAVAWTAHDLDAINLNHLNLETAKTVPEALAVASTMGMPPQNFVAGDSEGNIGWTIAGRIPIRDGYDPWLPADWSTGAGWQGWVAPDDYPRVLNPASGRIWTANARVADGAALKIVGDGGYDLGARQKQIRDALMSRSTFSTSDMLEVQNDDRALFLGRWRDLLIELVADAADPGAGERESYLREIENWIPRASVDSVGYRLVREFRQAVRSSVFEMLMMPVRQSLAPDSELRISNQFEGPLWQLVTQRPPHLLSADYSSWEEFLLTVVDNQIARMQNDFSGGIELRTWGERNTARVRHPLSRVLSPLSAWLDMPADELSGDINMPKAIAPAFGASERFAVSPGREEHAYLHMPSGQSGHPLSDFYGAGHGDWVRVVATPFLPGETIHRLQLKAH